MRRREVIKLVAGAAIWPGTVSAQRQGKVYRVGFLWDSPTVTPDDLVAFREGLRDLGWIEGQNVDIEFRWAEGRFERLPELANELVRLNVDVIVAPTSIYAEAAKRATAIIPIVFVGHADPLGSGHVASLASPGGNLTGTSLMMTDTNAKGLQLLKEAIPGLAHVAILYDPATPSHVPGLTGLQGAARDLSLRVEPVAVTEAAEFGKAFSGIRSVGAEAVVILATPLFNSGSKWLADLALEHKLATLFARREQAEKGGLISYGPDRGELNRRAASYVDAILKGARPQNLPVQQPTKFELVINLRTAHALGLSIPSSLLARADEVIE
jgi:putative tryptophan/tyrosine transport system substrate-binding protein